MDTRTGSGLPAPVIQALTAVLGPEHVSTSPVDRLANSRGVWPVELKTARQGQPPLVPACVAWPASTREVSAVMRIASRARVPVIPFGGGSGIVGGTQPVPGCISLDTKRLKGLRVDEVSLVAHAQAGLFGIDLECALNTRGLSLGHFPQSIHSSTVGGWVATRASGTFSSLHGNIEDRVVGLEVVLANGDVLRTRPVPRSSTGPDLNELFLGSEGTLGIVTEVALWLHPVPQARVWDSYSFPGFGQAIGGIRAMLQAGLRPAVVRLYDAAETAHKFASLDLPSGTCLLVLIFEGLRDLAETQSRLGRSSCQAWDGRELGSGPAGQWWETRFDTAGMVLANARAGGVSDAIEVSALWADLERVYESMRQAARRLGASVHAHVSHVYPSGAGLYVIFHAGAADDQEAKRLYTRIVDELLAACHEAGGSISHHHGVGVAKAAWMQAEHGAAGQSLLRALKASLDPHGIMNPGKLGLGS